MYKKIKNKKKQIDKVVSKYGKFLTAKSISQYFLIEDERYQVDGILSVFPFFRRNSKYKLNQSGICFGSCIELARQILASSDRLQTLKQFAEQNLKSDKKLINHIAFFQKIQSKDYYCSNQIKTDKKFMDPRSGKILKTTRMVFKRTEGKTSSSLTLAKEYLLYLSVPINEKNGHGFLAGKFIEQDTKSGWFYDPNIHSIVILDDYKSFKTFFTEFSKSVYNTKEVYGYTLHQEPIKQDLNNQQAKQSYCYNSI